jgi:hypothetical protein
MGCDTSGGRLLAYASVGQPGLFIFIRQRRNGSSTLIPHPTSNTPDLFTINATTVATHKAQIIIHIININDTFNFEKHTHNEQHARHSHPPRRPLCPRRRITHPQA